MVTVVGPAGPSSGVYDQPQVPAASSRVRVPSEAVSVSAALPWGSANVPVVVAGAPSGTAREAWSRATVGTWPTVVRSVTLLSLGFGSPLVGPTEAVLVMTVPAGVPLATWTTRVKVAELLANIAILRAVTVPLLLPTGGALPNQPRGGVHETKVVLVGKPSAKVMLLWVRGLLLDTVSW